MRKTLLIILLIITLLPIATVAYGGLERYKGYDNYSTLYDYIRFYDTTKLKAKPSIDKIASLLMVRGIDYRHYDKNSYLTYEDAISILVRLMGIEDIGQKKSKEYINMDNEVKDKFTTNEKWVKGHVNTLIERSIITGNEINKITYISDKKQKEMDKKIKKRLESVKNPSKKSKLKSKLEEKLNYSNIWKRPITREQFMVWIGRALEVEEKYGQSQNYIYTLLDMEKIETENIPIIEGLMRKGIVTGYTDKTLKPKGKMTRVDVARFIDKIVDYNLVKNGYKIQKGDVYKINKIVTTKADELLNDLVYVGESEFKIKNNDSTFANIKTIDSEDSRNDNGFIVLKDGKVYTQNIIDQGDYIKYYVNKKGEVIYAKVLD